MDTPDDRARITRITAENFRSIGSVDLELGDLTVLVGRNGAGKSNAVDVLRFLRDLVATGFEQTLVNRGGIETIVQRGSETVGLGVTLFGPTWECRYAVSLSRVTDSARPESISVRALGSEWVRASQDEIPFVPRGGVLVNRPDNKRPLLSDIGSQAVFESLDGATEEFLETLVFAPQEAAYTLSFASFYDIIPSSLRTPQRLVHADALDEEGDNLVAVLRGILAGPDGDRVRQALRMLVDGATDLEVQGLGSHLIAEVVYGVGGDGEPQRFDLGLESDGTIRLIAILAALYQSPPRTLVVIEEPERNIHPGALAVLASVIKEVSTRMQVVVTTHSPDLIDHFAPEDIRVVERVGGATVVGPMDATQREAVRAKLFTTGELMRMEGLNREAS